MRLTLISFDLKPGDVVLAKGNYRDKTVALVIPTYYKDVMVTWTCRDPQRLETTLRGRDSTAAEDATTT